MSTLHAPSHLPAGHVSHSHISGILQNAVNTVFTWADRAVKRRELRDLLMQDDRVLDDIGLSRDAVMREAFKAFWRA